MIIEINKHTTLGEISEQFSKYYPFLKIEFFNDSPRLMEASNSGSLLLKSLCVGDIVSLRHTVLLEFHFWNKTGMVESVFQKKVGLEAQVYRRHGDCWIQTSGTDELTLEEQNSIGKFDSEDVLHGTNRTNKL
jgi:hypothetical protein